MIVGNFTARWRTQFIIFCFFPAVLVSCGPKEYDYTTIDGKAALLDAVNIALTQQDCTTAVALIEPAYQSSHSDDSIRIARAAAYGCAANINFFKLVGDLAENDLAGSGFWITMAKLFPSVTTDSRVTSGQFATDALMAIRNRGSITDPVNLIHTDTPNVGSLIVGDRSKDSNIYLLFVSMSLIGALQNRYSATDPSNYHRTRVLGYTSAQPAGWAVATNVNAEGCTYAGAVLNFLDSLTEVGGYLNSKISSVLSTLGGTLSIALSDACDRGCQGAAAGYPSTCSFPAGSCTPCPTLLRHYSSCTSVATDKASCAAAGIAHFINTNPVGWPL